MISTQQAKANPSPCTEWSPAIPGEILYSQYRSGMLRSPVYSARAAGIDGFERLLNATQQTLTKIR